MAPYQWPEMMVAEDRLKVIEPKDTFQIGLPSSARAWSLFWDLVVAARGGRSVGLAQSCRSSSQVQVLLKPGTRSSIPSPGLSPYFLEVMLGWPLGWTDPGSSVTGFARWLQRSRTALSAMLWLKASRTAERVVERPSKRG